MLMLMSHPASLPTSRLPLSTPRMIFPRPLLYIPIILTSMLRIKIRSHTQLSPRLKLMQERRNVSVTHDSYPQGLDAVVDVLLKHFISTVFLEHQRQEKRRNVNEGEK